jgi:uncharacterized protein YbjT (DUF2867 family)
MGKKAVVIGANGLVGKQCVEQLLEDSYYSEVVVLTRKYFPMEHPKLVKEMIEFKDLHQSWALFAGDDMYYCLGTTMAKAGKRANFKKIEYDYAVNIAQIAHHNKMKQLLIVSAKGANPNSWIFYNKIKGQLEEELQTIGFKSLKIFRPALLLGKRDESRIGESIAQSFFKLINFAMIGPLVNIKALKAEDVAKAMITTAKQNTANASFISNKEIHQLAQGA